MQGGHQQQEQDKVEILNAQITDLETRKKNLSTEIEAHYRAYKIKIDLDYNVKVSKVDDNNIKREAEFKKREDNLSKRETFLENKITTVTAELKAKVDLVDKKLQEAEELKASYIQQYDKLTAEYKDKVSALEIKEHNIEEERESLEKAQQLAIDIQESVASIEQQNKEVREKLAVELKSVEGEKSYNRYISDENKKDEIDISSRQSDLKKKEIELESIESKIIPLEKSASERMAQANALFSKAEEENKVLKQQIAKNKEQGESLAQWRDELNELQLTLKEKERFFVIREREIDGKVAILKKLRSEGA